MRRGIAAALLVVAFAGSAMATGYDDYFRGIEALRAGNADLAITSLSSALSAGDLAPAYVPDAHMRRAEAYLRRQECAAAQADLDAALRLQPNMVGALVVRAAAEDCLNKPDAALADLSAAIALAPATAGFYRARGSFQWRHGAFAQAALDYAQAYKLAPKAGYLLIWYAISAKRAGTLDMAAFAAQASDFDGGDWQETLLDFLRGKESTDELYKDAADAGGDTAKGQKCEADFYVAEWRTPPDKQLLQQARDECPKNFVEYGAAIEDLKRIP